MAKWVNKKERQIYQENEEDSVIIKTCIANYEFERHIGNGLSRP